MSWIALKMLTGDRAKFFGIVLGLMFAAMLITQQGSIFCGIMMRTCGQIRDITGADLWVMDPNVRYIDDVKPMIETNLYRVRGVDGVQWAVPLYKGIGRVKLTVRKPDPARPGRFVTEPVVEQVVLLGLDDASLVGAPPRERILVGRLVDLRRPDAVLIDFNRLPKIFPNEPWKLAPKPPSAIDTMRDSLMVALNLHFGPTAFERYREAQRKFYARFLNRELEMNDHRALIVGVCEATRTFQSNAVVYTTYSRAKRFVPQERKPLTYILAKTDPKTPAPPISVSWRERAERYIFGRPMPDPVAVAVASSISNQTGLRARTSDDFSWDTIWYFFNYTGIPINFGMTTILGFLVGTAIAGQTFYNFTIENIRQFGALKAMGASNARIVGMIVLQAAVTGVLGYGVGVGFASWFGTSSSGTELAFFTPWQLLPASAIAIVFICILASILSVRRVVVLEPAIVFRG